MKEDQYKHESIGDQVYEIPRVQEIAWFCSVQFHNLAFKELSLLYIGTIVEIILKHFSPKFPVILNKNECHVGIIIIDTAHMQETCMYLELVLRENHFNYLLNYLKYVCDHCNKLQKQQLLAADA